MGTIQRATITILVPTATSKWNVKLVFDKKIRGIKTRLGKNEACVENICTFENKRDVPLEEGQDLKLVHRLGFEGAWPPQLITLEFNGIKICGFTSGKLRY